MERYNYHWYITVKETEENSRMGKTADIFKKIREVEAQ